MSLVLPINPTPRFAQYDLAVGQTVVAVPFPFQDNDDLEITRISAAGVETLLAETADYTLTGEGEASGGQITLNAAGVAGEKIRIVGLAVLQRPTSVRRAGYFSSAAIDDDIDRGVIVDQELRRDVDRAWKSPFGAEGGSIFVGAEGTTPLFDANGNLVEGPDASDIAAAGENATAARLAAEQAALFEGPWFNNVGALLTDATLTYAGGSPSSVSTGKIVRTRAEGFSYQVAASDATDHHVSTAGGVKLYVLPPYNVLAFGAVGDQVADDSAVFVTALAAAGSDAVQVPWKPTGYIVAGLTAAQISRLYGRGLLMSPTGTPTTISTAPWIDATRAHDNIYNLDWQPGAWAGGRGSLWNGARASRLIRTGGYPSCGADLIDLTVQTIVDGPDFDVARTSWISGIGMTGGNLFAAWSGANGPVRGSGATYTGGVVAAHVINVGNVLKYEPLRRDWTTAYPLYVGIKIGADPIPSRLGSRAGWTVTNITIGADAVFSVASHDFVNNLALEFSAGVGGTLPGGITANVPYYIREVAAGTFKVSATRGGPAITTTGTFAGPVTANAFYPAHYGIAINQTVHGARWHVGYANHVNSVAHNGLMMMLRGGSAAADQPAIGIEFRDNIAEGISFANATLSGNAISFALGQKIAWGSGASLVGQANGRMELYASNGANMAFTAGWNGISTVVGFHGTTGIIRQTLNAAATDLASVIALTNQMRAAMINYGLAA